MWSSCTKQFCLWEMFVQLKLKLTPCLLILLRVDTIAAIWYEAAEVLTCVGVWQCKQRSQWWLLCRFLFIYSKFCRPATYMNSFSIYLCTVKSHEAQSILSNHHHQYKLNKLLERFQRACFFFSDLSSFVFESFAYFMVYDLLTHWRFTKRL